MYENSSATVQQKMTAFLKNVEVFEAKRRGVLKKRLGIW